MNRRQLGLTISAIALFGGPTFGMSAAASALIDSVEGARRTAKNTARDKWRHPAATLAFWGLAPGMTVIEVDPAGGYWTEIVAAYLSKTNGRYVAAMGGDMTAFQARFSDKAIWGDVRVAAFGTGGGDLAPTGSADMVITARNIHDWMWTPGRLDKALGDFHAALKPDGLLAVEEHRADPRPMVPEARDGYVNTAWLVAAVERAGFRLQASTDLNANPLDTKDHPFGVWTLPPTRRTHAKDQPTPPGFDSAKYEAIGESDRMTLRFRKV